MTVPVWLVNFGTWLLASIVGGGVAVFAWGRVVGRRQAKTEADIVAARKSREGIHRAIDEIKGRLEEGDEEMKKQLVKLAEHNVRLEGVIERFEAQSRALGQLMPRSQCDIVHKAVDRRLDVLEGTKR